MKLQALALASFLLLSSHAQPPGKLYYGFQVIRASPESFADVAGIRPVWQTGMLLEIDPGLAPPDLIRVSTRSGAYVELVVTRAHRRDRFTWEISTDVALLPAPDGKARLYPAYGGMSGVDPKARGVVVALR